MQTARRATEPVHPWLYFLRGANCFGYCVISLRLTEPTGSFLRIQSDTMTPGRGKRKRPFRARGDVTRRKGNSHSLRHSFAFQRSLVRRRNFDRATGVFPAVARPYRVPIMEGRQKARRLILCGFVVRQRDTPPHINRGRLFAQIACDEKSTSPLSGPSVCK